MITFEPERYRRSDDEPMRVLILLEERVAKLQEIITKQDNPCELNSLKIKYIEKLMWISLSIGGLLAIRVLYLIIDRLIQVAAL